MLESVMSLPQSSIDKRLETIILNHVKKTYEENAYHKMNTARALGITKTRLYGYLMDMGLHVTKTGYYGKRWPKYVKRQRGETVWSAR